MHEDLLQRHLELVIEANKTTNITRISSWEDGMLLHVEDSLIGLPELSAAPEGWYADIGSGCRVSGNTTRYRNRETNAACRFGGQEDGHPRWFHRRIGIKQRLYLYGKNRRPRTRLPLCVHGDNGPGTCSAFDSDGTCRTPSPKRRTPYLL